MNDRDPYYLGHRKRLRERFIKTGLEGFADYEIVEFLLTRAILGASVRDQNLGFEQRVEDFNLEQLVFSAWR